MAYISLATLVLFGTFITHAATQDSFFECMPGMPSPGGKRANRIGLTSRYPYKGSSRVFSKGLVFRGPTITGLVSHSD